MAAFNFEVFKAEFKQKRLLQDVAELFGALRNPEEPQQRLLPVDPGTPLHGFMQKLRTEATPAPNFDFELGEPITIEDAANRCAERRQNGEIVPVNLPDMLVTAGQRLFFNTAMQQPATFVEISRPEASDLPSEVAACHFLDGAKKVIDWAQSLPSLKRLARARLYTEAMARHALHRLVSLYTPEHSHMVSDMTANEMANYLISTETNRDKTTYRRKELFELTRKPDMDLRAPLTTARRLIDMIFPANRPEMAMQRSAAWRTAIISFLPDDIAVPISDRLKIANEKCRPISDEELEAMAYQAEEAYKRPLAFPLKYGRNVGSLPATSMIQFNSIENGAGIIPNYGMPVTGYGRLYQTYPPFPPMVDNNLVIRQQEAARQAERDQLAAEQATAAEQAALLQQQLAAQLAAQQEAAYQQRFAEQQEAEFFNQQLAALQQQQQQAAAALLLRPPENTPQQQVVPAAPQTPARPNAGAGAQILSPAQIFLRDAARRNLEEQETLQTVTKSAVAALREARSPAARPLPDYAAGVEAEGEIDELELTPYERVFSRGGVQYVQKGDKILRVVQSATEPERPASETGATRKKGKKTSTPLGYEPIIQTRRQKEEEQRRKDEQDEELWSVNLQVSE
jgi:hypothetical protein